MTRVVVLGGGIAGIAAACRLLQHDVSVTVVDEGHRGSATTAAAGVISPVSVAPTTDALAGLRLRAVRHYAELQQWLSADGITEHGITASGQVVIGQHGTALDSLEERFWQLARQHGGHSVGRLERLDVGQLRATVPWIAPSARQGIYLSAVLRADGRQLLRSLTKALLARRGAILHGVGTPVVNHGRLTGVQVAGQAVGCDAVILAVGAWADSPLLHQALRIPVRPERGQLVHVKIPAPSRPAPIVSTTDGDYALGFPRGRIVLGGTREAEVTDACVTAGGIQQVLARAGSVVAGLDDARFVAARAGLRPHSVDGSPVVGADPRVTGAYHVQALGSLGLTAGPYLGARCADAALGMDLPELAPFAASRVLAA